MDLAQCEVTAVQMHQSYVLYCAKPSPWYTQWDISCEPDLSNDLVLLRTIDSHVTMRLAKGLSLLLCRYLEAGPAGGVFNIRQYAFCLHREFIVNKTYGLGGDFRRQNVFPIQAFHSILIHMWHPYLNYQSKTSSWTGPAKHPADPFPIRQMPSCGLIRQMPSCGLPWPVSWAVWRPSEMSRLWCLVSPWRPAAERLVQWSVRLVRPPW